MNILLFGLGPHAKRIYYPLLEKYEKKYEIEIIGIVDLEDQKEKIDEYLKGRMLQPRYKFFVSTKNRNTGNIDDVLEDSLEKILVNNTIDGVIISTEPKAHMQYANWALKNRIKILIDKPISAPVGTVNDIEAAKQIYTDFETLLDLTKKNRSSCYVQCQRRYHLGYNFIWKYLSEFVEKYEVPLTFMDIYHADGMWNMPNEFFSRENHPYKYGYGKMLHSGYHFLDLYSWFNEINQSLEKYKADKVGVYAQSYRPYDFFHSFDGDFYKKNLSNSEIIDAVRDCNKVKLFGELDVNMLLTTYKNDRKISTTSSNLLQNSFSRRAWDKLPKDTYKGNGRVRHERFNVQVSHLLNIQVHSYQSYEVKKKDVDTIGAGHEDHFDIYIFRNSELIGGKTLEKLSIGEIMKESKRKDTTYKGHNEEARENCFIDFMDGNNSIAELHNHEFTCKLLSTIYSCLVEESKGEIPYKMISL